METSSHHFTCFVCSNTFQGLQPLFYHLRTDHAIVYSSDYFACAEDGCQRTFSTHWPYKRHLLKHVLSLDTASHDVGECPMEVSPLDNTVDDEVSDGDDPGESIHGYEQNTPQPQSRSESVTVDLHAIAANFVSKMKAKSNVPLSSLQNIIECTSEMFSEIVGMLENETLRVMEETGVELEGEKVQHLKKIFKDSCSPFAGFESQYKQEKYFADKGTYIPPVSIPLGVAFNPKRDAATGGVRQSQTHDSFQYIPIKDVLRAVLNQDGVLDSIEQYRSATADDDLKDFKDGEFYKCHPCLGHQDCVNILLYFDELETTNPLRGNGTHKLGMDLEPQTKSGHAATLIQRIDNIEQKDLKNYLRSRSDGRALYDRLNDLGFAPREMRAKLVRFAVGYLFEKSGRYPKSDEKISLAREIIEVFPFLRSPRGSGCQAFYQQARDRKPAKGFIHDRINNIRKQEAKMKTKGKKAKSCFVTTTEDEDYRFSWMSCGVSI
ncbi:uncharacterized protein LOC135500297 isoform X2 [Lineus longissimus]|uniref:uncharacterized protein LOC135500297 isoform X2 n=1 Tax=Lineus longissimus TaxID=88925 RepID=UPI00315C986F